MAAMHWALSRRSLLKGASSAALIAVATPAWAFRAEPTDAFIDALIAKMSLAEKAGQLSIYRDATRPEVPDNNPETLLRNKTQVVGDVELGLIGGLFNGVGVEIGRELQTAAVERSPNGIPLIFAADVIHGLRTIFPIPLGETASFDLDLVRRTARASAVESTAAGLHWTFAPMVDIARDQRWGRVMESAGEDTYLGCRMAEARVAGFQGDDLGAEDSLLACPKHFAAYGAVQGGMEYNTADISESTLRSVHFPPFKAAFDAGALTTMTSFSDVAGVPATGSRFLLTEVLRGEWDFQGLVVSDFRSDMEMIAHGYAADGPDATQKAIMAGCDISMHSGFYTRYLPDLVASGKVPMEVVDRAVRRVLRVKKALGLFENPYRSLDPQRERTQLKMPETLALAREAGRKSIVLLKNEGDLLPLPKSGKKIALIGPFGADKDNLNGAWSLFAEKGFGVTLEDGLRAALSNPADLTVTPGCAIEESIPGGIEAAMAAARSSDVVVLALGESSLMSGEGQARSDITLPVPQLVLAEAIAATGKPVVILLRHGRALALTGAVREAPAIMATWFLGSETGHAIADVLFGDHAPQGRLPVSFPSLPGQQPFYYNHRTTGRPEVVPAVTRFQARYREGSNVALFPFGHGLTYAKIAYGAPQLDQPAMAWDGRLIVTAELTNQSARAGREVVQLYIRDRAASVTQPIQALRAFQIVELGPNETRTVSFTLTRADLEIVDAELKTLAEPGEFDVWIAPSAATGVSARFQLLAD